MRAAARALIGEEGEKAYAIVWAIAQGTRESKKWIGGGGDSGPVEVTQLPSVKEQLEAASFLIERLQGKSPQAVELTGEDGTPLTVSINLSRAPAPAGEE